ncbi:glutamine amidotransferase, partial [Verrucomicrobiota bacterium]
MIIFEHTIATIIIGIGIAVSIIVIAFSFWRYLEERMLGLVLGLIRLLFLALLIWCMLQPAWQLKKIEKVKPRFIVVVDKSKSMLLKPKEESPTRWAVIQDALKEPWKAIIAAECDIDTYPFSTKLDSRISLDDAMKLEPDGEGTFLRNTLDRLKGLYTGQNITGVLLLSDGTDSQEVYDDWVAQEWPWPIFSMRVEEDAVWEKIPDIRIDAVKTKRRVTVGWNTEMEAVISGEGTKGGAINVELYKNNKRIQSLPTVLPSEGGTKKVVFPLSHPEIGVFNYQVSIPLLPKEANTNDNSYMVNVRVVDTKNRVLYVEGTPRWESKYLSRILKGSERITPLIFIQGPNKKFIIIGNRGSMTTDMKASQLAFFKVVIIGNLTAEELTEERAENLVKYTEEGGSLVLLGGFKAWGPEGLWETSLAKVMPFKGHNPELQEGNFPMKLTDAGLSHPAFAGDPEFWKTIPPVLSIFPGAKLAPAANALIVAQSAEGLEPVIVTHRYGQGKVLAILTDSLWKWKLSPTEKDAQPYERFWHQMMTWLEPTDTGEGAAHAYLEVFTDREQVFLNETIEFSVRKAEAEEGKNNDQEVTCEITSPDERKTPFSTVKQQIITPSGQSFSGFSTEYTAEMAGLHSVVAIAGEGPDQLKSSPVSFFVKAFTPESIPKPSNFGTLRA